MSLVDVSVKRPVFITCIVLSMLAVGFLCFKRLSVDMFPNVTFPIIMVKTPYPGAGPSEIETLVSKVLEDEFSDIPGIKSLRSISQEGMSTTIVEFELKSDISSSESQIRDRIVTAKRKMPEDIKEPVVRRLDPAQMPIIMVALKSQAEDGQIYELASDKIKPFLEQTQDVGQVSILGGRQREIRVELDQNKLKQYNLSASQVATQMAASGQNIPVGKFSDKKTETIYRALGEYRSIKDVGSTIVSFFGNDVPVTINDLAKVKDSLEDQTTKAKVNGEKSLLLWVFKQSGTNTIEVAQAIRKRVDKLNLQFSTLPDKPSLEVVWDNSRAIHANVEDVKESILIGIVLTILVVFLFLGNIRSTLITSLALPNSLLGAFILMYIAGFTINMMSLLALSLAVGLLVDDAIVVRENIFRHLENGEKPMMAAVLGTKEVALAVIATTMAVIAVFAPVGFLSGVVGQFFKEFGLTVCFTMMISLFDALTIAPMMSAYLAGGVHSVPHPLYRWTIGVPIRAFEVFQTWLDKIYAVFLKICLKVPSLVLILAGVFFFQSLQLAKKIPATFMSPQDFGEFSVSIEMPASYSLDATEEVAAKVQKLIHSHKEVETSILTVGDRDGSSHKADFFVHLVPSEKRSMNTTEFKDILREHLKSMAYANPKVKDIDIVGGGMRPFTVNIAGENLDEVEKVATKVMEKLKNHPGLKDPDINLKPGKNEKQVWINRNKAEQFGIATNVAGGELRTLIEGAVPAVLREHGKEYDIRVRLKDDQRNLEQLFPQVSVPNINRRAIPIKNFSEIKTAQSTATINRQNRGRYIQISADVAANGPGLKAVMDDVKNIFTNDVILPPGVSYSFVGQAESFAELIANIQVALGLAILFIFLVLASLYESFITPFTIMLVLPLAISGAFIGLFVTGKSLEINSMIGCILLLGLASKNSILLVDYANQQLEKGLSIKDAMLESGKTRLRPILMTTMALIMGMLPIAIGLNEASKQRTSMGVAVIGGLISSTVLSLAVVPAAYLYIERFRQFALSVMKKISPDTH